MLFECADGGARPRDIKPCTSLLHQTLVFGVNVHSLESPNQVIQ
jgi:hypothetical protein